MLSILCPHCRQKLMVEVQLQGTTISCHSCGQQLAVPLAKKQSPQESPPVASLSVTTPVTSVTHRRRKPAIGNRIISMTLHLSISLAAVYAGYYLVTHRPTRESEPEAEIADLTLEAPAVIKNPRAVQRLNDEETNVEPLAEPEEFELSEPQAALPEEPKSPFLETPTLAELPSAKQTTELALVTGLHSSRVHLLSNSPHLALRDGEIFWQSKELGTSEPIARLSLDEGNLNFRWLDAVEPEAEAALRNSLVRLEENEFAHQLRLRSAEETAPHEFDLGKSKQRVVGKFAHLVPTEHVFFELLNLEQLPACTVEGTEPTQLRISDQTTLEYLEAPGAATRLTMTKRGKVTVVEIESRYALPSGDEQPMSIGQGNKKFKALDALYQETLAAEAAIDDLRDRLKELEKQDKAVSRSRATAFAKAQQRQQLQSEAIGVQQKIGYAERLLSQKAAVAADLQALQKIAALAQQLHESKLSYRFYTLVDGHKLDLLIAR